MAFHGSSLSCSGNVSLREFGGMPCLGIRSFMEVARLCLTSPKQSSSVVGQTFGRSKTLVQPSSRCLPRTCRVKFDGDLDRNSEATTSGENSLLDLNAMERELNDAIEEENYDRAAKIRDSLKLLNEDGKTRVLAANARFYNAFRAGDLAMMQTLWAKNDDVCCVHPGAMGISGYDDVMTSWEYVWVNYEFPLDIEIKDVKVHVRGDMGYVTCVELVRTKGSSWGGQFVTNVFERVGDQWLICIHHASPVDL